MEPQRSEMMAKKKSSQMPSDFDRARWVLIRAREQHGMKWSTGLGPEAMIVRYLNSLNENLLTVRFRPHADLINDLADQYDTAVAK